MTSSRSLQRAGHGLTTEAQQPVLAALVMPGTTEWTPEECPPECHLMDLGTRAGMLNGADGGSEPILR